MNSCPLCGNVHTAFYHEDKIRRYLQCINCGLVFVPAEFHLSESEEKTIYDLHENDANDEGYQTFLRRLADPLIARLPPSSKGLDFGCGPGPALHLLLERAGHSVRLYDKFYARDEAVLAQRYHFITATEVVEHLSEPRDVLALLWKQLLPDGLLALMTKRVSSVEAFQRWHYKNDPTHIIFFSETTFRWLAKSWQADVEFPAADVVIFHKCDPF